MKIVAYTLLILSGLFFDLYSVSADISLEEWQDIYSTVRDIQFVGYALLAFELCPYSQSEAKALTFFMAIWRTGMAVINYFSMGPFYNPALVLAILIVFLGWFFKALLMGEYRDGAEQAGAYHIFFPVHSYWGLLQSVFLPWHPARYESRMISDGQHVWTIRHRKFVKYDIERLNSIKSPHVKVYLGRGLTKTEKTHLSALEGKKATPFFRDCREFLTD